mmetsp:Transcript_53504/g.148399  ORF Transcript_53504/g.148399 Transcript_53504/m.148399 type:complete len:346 (-) Transcript_53504:606-1643(-)
MARSPTDVMVRRRCEHRPRAVVLRAVDAVVDEVGHPRRARLAAEVVAELVEEDDAPAILVDLAELHLWIRRLNATECKDHLELVDRHAAVTAVALVEDPVQLVEVEQVHDKALELLAVHELVLPLHRLLVAAHERRLVVQQRVVLDHELIDLGEGHDAISVEVQLRPHLPEARAVRAERLDLVLEVVEVLHGLGLHVVVQRRPVAARAERLVPAHLGPARRAPAGVRRDRAAHRGQGREVDVARARACGAVARLLGVLAAEDVRVELGVVVGVHPIPYVGAELDEEHLPAAVRVDLLELLLRLCGRHGEAQHRQRCDELSGVDPPIATGVHHAEDLPKFPEPEQI